MFSIHGIASYTDILLTCHAIFIFVGEKGCVIIHKNVCVGGCPWNRHNLFSPSHDLKWVNMICTVHNISGQFAMQPYGLNEHYVLSLSLKVDLFVIAVLQRQAGCVGISAHIQ